MRGTGERTEHWDLSGTTESTPNGFLGPSGRLESPCRGKARTLAQGLGHISSIVLLPLRGN